MASSAPSVYLPAEPVLSLPPALYDEARERYYRVTGSPRDDGALPLRADPLRVARKVTGAGPLFYTFDAPLEDRYLGDDVRPAPEGTRTTTVQPTDAERAAALRARQPQPRPRTVEVPDPSRSVHGIARPHTERLTVQAQGAPVQQLYPRPIRPDLVGCWAREVSDTDHGRTWSPVPREGRPPIAAGEGPRTFAPHKLVGVYNTLQDAVIFELPAGARLLVRDPHPWLPDAALPAPAPGTGYVWQVIGIDPTAAGTLTRFRLVEARAALFYREKRTQLVLDPATGGWLGKNTLHESGNLLSKLENAGGLAGDLYREIGRSAAGQIALTVAAGIVSLGAGAAIVQGGLAAGGTAAGLPPVSVAGAAGGQGTSTSLLVGGQGVQAGAGAAVAPVNAAAAARQVVLSHLSEIRLAADQGAPDAVDRLHVELAKATEWTAGLDGVYGSLYRLAAVAAQDPARRDRVRIAIAKAGAEATSTYARALSPRGLAITLAVVDTVRTAVVASATLGAETAAEAAANEALSQALEVAQRAVDTVQQLAEGLERAQLLRAVEGRVAEAQQAAVQDFVARLNAATSPAAPLPQEELRPDLVPSPAPAAPVSSAESAPAPSSGRAALVVGGAIVAAVAYLFARGRGG